MSIGKHLRRWFRVRLSTLIVATLTASVLVGINLRPYEFYFPRPPWVADLKYLVVDREHPDPLMQCGVYGWPVAAFPSWNWSGNNMPEGEFPQLAHFGSGMNDVHVACNWAKWNTRALIVDAIANAVAFVAALLLWVAVRRFAVVPWRAVLTVFRKFSRARNTPGRSYI